MGRAQAALRPWGQRSPQTRCLGPAQQRLARAWSVCVDVSMCVDVVSVRGRGRCAWTWLVCVDGMSALLPAPKPRGKSLMGQMVHPYVHPEHTSRGHLSGTEQVLGIRWYPDRLAGAGLGVTWGKPGPGGREPGHEGCHVEERLGLHSSQGDAPGWLHGGQGQGCVREEGTSLEERGGVGVGWGLDPGGIRGPWSGPPSSQSTTTESIRRTECALCLSDLAAAAPPKDRLPYKTRFLRMFSP